MDVIKVEKGKKWMGQVKHTISYNRKGKTPDNTTLIEIINKDKECNCYGNQIVLEKGGVYHHFGELNFLSENNCGLNYLVKIFMK